MNPAEGLAVRWGTRVRRNEPLAPHTTFRIGGPADWYIRAETAEELAELVLWARSTGTPLLVLGRGSNVLVSDLGWRGLVVANYADRVQVERTEGGALWRVESGAALPSLAGRTAHEGWRGFEWAIGVPGSVGGAVVGNAGAHGGCVADSLVRTRVLTSGSQDLVYDNAGCEFAYRSSRFKRDRGAVVLEATFHLEADNAADCVARLAQYTEYRRRTQPVEPSVGSMFKNPPGMAAGRLIDEAGLKGMVIGAIQVSPVHGNFFINRGGGRAAEVCELVRRVQARVREQAGVELELEIELAGDFPRLEEGNL